jgi:hypothetical protein
VILRESDRLNSSPVDLAHLAADEKSGRSKAKEKDRSRFGDGYYAEVINSKGIPVIRSGRSV